MTTAEARFPISVERLRRYVESLGAIGRLPSGGLDRPVYSPAWQAACDQVAAWMVELGLQVRRDAVGSVFGRLEGREPGPVVLTGSHIDTVPNGGAYDGAVGIHAGLAAVAALIERYGQPRRGIEVVATCEEEGSRFPARFWAARAMTGAIDPAEADSVVDAHGTTIGDAMRSVGLDPSRIADAARNDVSHFVELHVEQSAVLDRAGIPVGIVPVITGQERLRVEVLGRADHAGATPMSLRQDAYLPAAEMALAIATVAREMGDPAVATVGWVALEPGAVNVVPAAARFTVDARHPDPVLKAELVASIRQRCQDIAAAHRVGLNVTAEMSEPPAPMNAGLVMLLEQHAQQLGLPYRLVVSGAGHDSQVISRSFPTAMIFVPSQDGRSHCPEELTPVEQIVPGTQLLAATLHNLAY